MSGDTDPVRLLLVAEAGMLGDGIVSACETAPDIEVVARIGQPGDLAAVARSTGADVALLTPAATGHARACALRPGVPAILLTDAESREELIVAVETGACGYLSTGAGMDELLEGIRAVAHGKTLVPSAMLTGLLEGLVERRRRQQDALLRTSGLTRREREVLCLLARGLDTNGIANALVISRETARTHVQNLLGKLRVHSRLEAAAFVSESGILQGLEAEAH